MRCAAAQKEMTALADGALAPHRAARVRAHIDLCAACERELRAVTRTVELARGALAGRPPELSPGFETRLRQRLAEAAEPAPGWRWRWLWKPALAGGLAVAGILLAAAPLGGPSAVFVPLGIQPPPPKVAEKPELFKDYAIIERLEELENFDTVEALPLEDETLGGESKGSA